MENDIILLIEQYKIDMPIVTKKGTIGSIYLFLNTVNYKVYIGKTIRNYKTRFTEHKYHSKLKSNNYFHNAIFKYGYNSFKTYVIYQTDLLQNKKEVSDILDTKESYFINIFKSNNSKYGYNLTNGGTIRYTYKLCKEASTNISNSNKTRSKKILQFDKNFNFIKEWNSIEDAEKCLNLFNISECCSKNRKTCGNYLWVKKEDYRKDYFKDLKEDINKKTSDKTVLQFSLDGKFINEFISCFDANEACGSPRKSSTVSKAASGIRKQAKGFIWIYKSDFSNELLEEKIKQNKIIRG